MKYLFIVQGEGRGHLTQAIALADILRNKGHEVVEVLVGQSKNRELPSFFYEKIGAKVRQFESPNFSFSKKNNKVNIAKTILLNLTPTKQKSFLSSLELLHKRIKKSKPDVVVNFYEILAGLLHFRYNFAMPFVSIGHQFIYKHPDFPYAKGRDQNKLLLRLYTQLCNFGSTKTLALSLYPMTDVYRDRIAVVPPLLRKELFAITPQKKPFILGYVVNNAYAEEVKAWHKKNPDTELHFFWDKKDAPEVLKIDQNLHFHRIDDLKFLEYMGDCSGFATTAGFEAICEAIYLKKPIFMVPSHIEQEINAEDTKAHRAGTVSRHFDLDALVTKMYSRANPNKDFTEWVNSAEEVFVRHLTTLV